jgi:hypothetical protein
MKIKRYAFSLALAAATVSNCFTPNGDVFAQAPNRVGPSSVGHIGDSSKSISDVGTAAPPQKLDRRPTEFRTNLVDTDAPYDPSVLNTLNQPQSQNSGMPRYISSSSNAAATGISIAGPRLSKPLRLGQGSSAWVEFDTLLWFRDQANTPPLATRNTIIGNRPQLGNAGTEVLAGGDVDSRNLLVGYRAGIGTWLNSQKTFGVGGKVFGLFNSGDSETFTSNGDQALGVPFFNTNLGIEDAQVVAINTGVLGTNTGSITIENDLDVFGAELYSRINILRSGCCQWDLIGGYMFAKVNDSIGLSTSSINGVTDSIQNGTLIETRDEFSTKNTFHGGQLGILASVTKNHWSLSSNTRIGLGSMNQEYNAAGSLTTTAPGGGPVTTDGGLLAQGSNSVPFERSVFTFIPQVDLKLGYRVSDALTMNVGYNFIFFPDVALAGSEIDRNVDTSGLGTPVFPQAQRNNDSLWLQGVSLGGTYSF